MPPGVQDYRPAMYGGILAIELGIHGVQTRHLPVDATALTDRLVVAYTGASRHSGINNWDVFKSRIDGVPAVARAFTDIGRAATTMRTALEAGDWPAAARSLADEWAARKRLAPGVGMCFHQIKTAPGPAQYFMSASIAALTRAALSPTEAEKSV